ncbi:MAG: ATP-dependent RNA helicase HrpA, partial [Methylococcales bacterium]
LPLFSRLGAKDQERIFHPEGTRRIVLATNIAETSLTVPGIRSVIDSGLARISRYSPRGKIQRLPVEKIARASADQRAGRCGRLGPGICIRLYSEQDYLERPQFTDPEILRTNLAAVILQMKALKLGEIEQFPFLDAPDRRMIRDGLKLLEELNAIDANQDLTEIGGNLARIPLDPRLGRIVLAAKQENCLSEIAIITSALSIQDPRERPAEQSQAADEKHRPFQDKDSDFLSFIKIWNTIEAKREELSNSRLKIYCRENFLSWRRLREWRDIVVQLLNIIQTEFGFRVNPLPADYEKVHKACLSGFLSQIGFLKDQSEYLGARNLKFHIHPGSGLFKVRPKWIVAAEQVETGRVYARNLARVTPEWIEQAGQHLVRREHFDPHWQKSQGRVAVHERSVLFGLVLQQSRKIPYERINPAGAREIFIRSALVEQDFECNARFFRHNQALLEELSLLQQKGRRVDLIADEQVLFDFFDERIPESVVDGDSFNRWRREIEKTQPDLLLLTREALLGNHEGIPGMEQYPDHLMLGNLTVKLAYRFEPGHVDDGVTAIIPLHQLNQISSQSFEWLVPGLLKEKVTALIKALPKSIRRNFVPASDNAERFLAFADHRTLLSKSLAAWLSDQKPIKVLVEQWSDCRLPDYLLMNFQIVDDDSNVLASGRDLKDLQIRLAAESTQVFTSLSDTQRVKTGSTRWDFGEIPEREIIKNPAGQTLAYPALVDEGESVGLRLVNSEIVAQSAHQSGLARLIILQLKSEIKYLKQKIRASRAAYSIYSELQPEPWLPNGTPTAKRALDEDLVQRIVRTVFLDEKPAISNESGFQTRLTEQKHQLVETAENLFEICREIFRLFAEITTQLASTRLNPTSLADIREQRSKLIYTGFIAKTPVSRLQSYPRFLKAILHRIEKAVTDESKDLKQIEEILPLWSSYWNFVKNNPEPIAPELDDYRWRLEELRLSLFAQNLKTAYPVSCKRLEKIWDARC